MSNGVLKLLTNYDKDVSSYIRYLEKQLEEERANVVKWMNLALDGIAVQDKMMVETIRSIAGIK